MRRRYEFVPEAFKGDGALEIAWIVGIEPKFRRQKLETKEKICQDLNIVESCDAILRVAKEKRDGISVATVNNLGIAMAGVVRAMSTVADSTLDEIKKMLTNFGTNILDPLQAPEPRNEEAIQESVVLGAVGSDFGSLNLGNIDVPVSVELVDVEDVDVDEILSVYNQERNSESASITLEDFNVQEWWNNPGRIDPGIFNSESQELPSMDIEDLDVMYDRVSWSLGHQINTPPRNIDDNAGISSDVGMEFGAVGAAEFNQNDVGTIERGRNADFESFNEEPTIEEGRLAEIASISEERTIERGRDVQAAIENELDSRGQFIGFHVNSEVEYFENQSVEHAGTNDELPHVPSIHVPEAPQSIVPEVANNPRRRRRKRLIIDQARRIELDRNFDYSGPGEHKPFDCIIPQELKFAARSNNILNCCGRAMPSQRLRRLYTEMMRFASLRRNLVSPAEPVLRNALDEMRDTPPAFEPCHQENGHQSLPLGDITMTDGDDRIEAQDAAAVAQQVHIENDNSTLDNIEMGDEIISFVTIDGRNYGEQPRDDPDATIQAIPLSLEETLRIENDPSNTSNRRVEDPSATSDSDLDLVRNGTAKRVKRSRNVSASKIRRVTTGATSRMPSPYPNSSDDEDRNMRVHHTMINSNQVDQSPLQIFPNVLEDANSPNSQPNQSLPPPDHRDDAASDIGSSTSGNSSTFLFVPRVHISESILSDGASLGSLFTDIFPPATTPRIVAAKAFLQILYMYGTKLLLQQNVCYDTQDVTIYPIRLCLLPPQDMELNSEEPN